MSSEGNTRESTSQSSISDILIGRLANLEVSANREESVEPHFKADASFVKNLVKLSSTAVYSYCFEGEVSLDGFKSWTGIHWVRKQGLKIESTDKAQSSDQQPAQWTGDAKPTLFRNRRKLVISSQLQPQADRGSLEQRELYRREFEQPEIDSGGSKELINNNVGDLAAGVREDQSADCRTQVNQAPEEGSFAPIQQRNAESNANEASRLVHDWSEVPYARLQEAQALLESEGTRDMTVEAPLQTSGSISVRRLRAVARSTDHAQVLDQVLPQVRPSNTDLLADEQPTKKRKQSESAADPTTVAQ
ncbi:hypothetical protein R1sor_022697 [Riccia sorocarpa]|uniref:Uncharacterized protein n=1 Tax=Riccia sorocarpa TaxID=122646 RepID=A0ABD3GMD1_9MARC